jgi:hypothetical protein
MSKAREKFCPRSWLVAACSALPSPINPSQVYVSIAPGNRSDGLFTPVITGRANAS